MIQTRRNFLQGWAALAPSAVLAADRGDSAAAPGPLTKAWVEVEDRVVRAAVPAHFLSFNLHSISLDSDHWDPRTEKLHPEILSGMRAFPGAIYRYPGGNISNNFAWEWSIGDQVARRAQKGEEWYEPLPVRFGPKEYFDFVRSVGGRSWYTLNLVGWSETETNCELPSEFMAASNGRLARFRVDHDTTGGSPRYYHLGNELDRNVYEWPADKYIARCRDTMAQVRAADPDARFVAFLRDFDTQYKKRGGGSRGTDQAVQVLAALPEIKDVSLQVYYDRNANEGAQFDQTWRWSLIDRFIQSLPQLGGQSMNVWVSEHAKSRDVGMKGRPREIRLASTSGMRGAIASADFCIAALQRPWLQATMWHALGGGVWWDLFNPKGGGSVPTPVLRMFKLLRAHSAGEVLQCQTLGTPVGGYAGGYDLRCAVLRDPAAYRHTVWVANRAPAIGQLSLRIPGLARRPLRVEVHSLAAPTNVGKVEDLRADLLTAKPVTLVADADGRLSVTVPALSVAVVVITANAG